MNILENRKQQVCADWATDETAAVWQKYYRVMREQLADVTAALVDAANPRSGEVALDLASGTGEPAIPLARRVAPLGRLTATDLNPAMLAALQHNAKEQGVDNIETRVVDAEAMPFGDSSFDLVTSRFGAMFFVDIEKALSEIRRVLRPNGRLALMVWGAAVPGTYFGDLVVPFVKRMADKPDPDGPGPMRFAEPGKLARLIERAGFSAVREKSLDLPSKWPGNPEDSLAAVLEIAAPFRKAVDALSEEDRRAATDEAYAALRPRFDGVYTHSIAPIILLTAAKV